MTPATPFGVSPPAADQLRAPVARPSERIGELDLCLQRQNALRSLLETQIPRILAGLIGLVRKAPQPQNLGPGHLPGDLMLVSELSLGVVFTFHAHLRSPSLNRDLTICSYFVLTSHGQQN